MFLRALEVKGYRSLEDVKLLRLSNLNVLIGRNNSGKSSVASVIEMLSRVVWGRAGFDTESLADYSATKSLEITLELEVRGEARAEFISARSTSSNRPSLEADLLASSFLRRLKFRFANSPVNVAALELQETMVRTTDNAWASVQWRPKERPEQMVFANYDAIIQRHGSSAFDQSSFTATRLNNETAQQALPHSFAGHLKNVAWHWPLQQLAEFLQRAFFFSPFRHCEGRQRTEEANALLPNGSNLPQVLNTISSNNRSRFSRIEGFVHKALPEVGSLHARVVKQECELGFNATEQSPTIHIHKMGGGVEQLLMLATALEMTDDQSALFLEEPESHLHASAQRFLLQELAKAKRQIFVTTHSPVFLNRTEGVSLYRVSIKNRRTTISRVDEAEHLAEALSDVGVRNSDVLLSDAIVFVEGPSDRDVLTAWAKKLGSSFAERNITVLPMGGGRDAGRHAPVRSELLKGISEKSPVPHMFILDRDERSKTEVDNLSRQLGDRVHFLNHRELENYLLVPRAILAALRSKHPEDKQITEKLSGLTEAAIDISICTAVSSLRGTVLLKRIKAAIGGLREGLLPQDSLTRLLPSARSMDLTKRVREEIEANLKGHLDGIPFEELVTGELAALDAEWSNEDRRRFLAPGEEILKIVFSLHGLEFNKRTDTKRIAEEMDADEIDAEVESILRKTFELPSRQTG